MIYLSTTMLNFFPTNKSILIFAFHMDHVGTMASPRQSSVQETMWSESRSGLPVDLAQTQCECLEGADKSKLAFVSITVPEKRFWEKVNVHTLFH